MNDVELASETSQTQLTMLEEERESYITSGQMDYMSRAGLR